MKLHIGGTERKDGWTVLNAVPGPAVDIVGDCADLSMFADASVEQVYASHVIEHLGFKDELPRALKEVFRVLRPGGLFAVSVPDLTVLGPMIADPALSFADRWLVMTMIMGSQTDAYDFHKTGFTEDILENVLAEAGFSRARRVERFGLFHDHSETAVNGHPISLNIVAQKD